MDYCWFEGANRISKSLLAATILIVIGLGAKEIVQSTSNAPIVNIVTIQLCLGYILLLFYPLLLLFVSTRKYSITGMGMDIRYPFGFTVHYSWERFSEIALCKVRYAAKGPPRYSVAIRCVIGTEKRGPKHAAYAKEFWSSAEYEVLHFQKVISINYSKERYQQFLTLCPHAIVDYCELPDCPP